MPIHGHLPKSMPANQLVANARAALTLANALRDCDMSDMRLAAPSLVSHWPAWVVRAGALARRGAYCLWCQPHPDPRETFPSQLILNVPEGRYSVEVLDVSRSAWTSRDSAPGGPLVVGLPYTAGTLLVWIKAADHAPVHAPAEAAIGGVAAGSSIDVA